VERCLADATGCRMDEHRGASLKASLIDETVPNGVVDKPNSCSIIVAPVLRNGTYQNWISVDSTGKGASIHDAKYSFARFTVSSGEFIAETVIELQHLYVRAKTTRSRHEVAKINSRRVDSV